jgi:AraC-like DNA-binding protein
MALISASSDESITVESLARHAGISEVYFRRLFKSVTGISPAKYITDQKIRRAKELLELDYLTLEDVSERCGFSSLSYFCRVFKENVGMTPGEFRKTRIV